MAGVDEAPTLPYDWSASWRRHRESLPGQALGQVSMRVCASGEAVGDDNQMIASGAGRTPDGNVDLPVMDRVGDL